jgi:sec-independent protein translocase protein TatB
VFGVSFPELLVLGTVALLVLGPEKLPGMLRTMGQWVAKLRRLTTEVRYQSGIDDVLRAEGFEGGLNELRSVMRGGVHVPSHSPPVRQPVAESFVSDKSREYPSEGPDAYGALPEDLLGPSPAAPPTALAPPTDLAPPAALAPPETLSPPAALSPAALSPEALSGTEVPAPAVPERATPPRPASAKPTAAPAPSPAAPATVARGIAAPPPDAPADPSAAPAPVAPAPGVAGAEPHKIAPRETSG